jgi:hypothetical protein
MIVFMANRTIFGDISGVILYYGVTQTEFKENRSIKV